MICEQTVRRSLVVPWSAIVTIVASGPRAAGEGQILAERLTSSLRMELVLVKAGELTMGSSRGSQPCPCPPPHAGS